VGNWVEIKATSVTGNGVQCPGACTATYADGGTVTLTATAAPGYRFDSWSNCDAAFGNRCTMTMDADKSCTVIFTVRPAYGYTIASVSGCSGTLAENTYTTGPVTGDCRVSVTFHPSDDTTCNGGSIEICGDHKNNDFDDIADEVELHHACLDPYRWDIPTTTGSRMRTETA